MGRTESNCHRRLNGATRGCEPLEERRVLAAAIASIDYSGTGWAASYSPSTGNWLPLNNLDVLSQTGIDRIRVNFTEKVLKSSTAANSLLLTSPFGSLSPADASDVLLAADGFSATWTLPRDLRDQEIAALTVFDGAFLDADNNAAVPGVSRRLDVLPGDATKDGIVNINDFAVVRRTFGQRGERLASDFDADGVVAISDFAIVREQFSAVVEPGESAATAYNLGELTIGDTFLRNELNSNTGTLFDPSDWYRFEVKQSASLNVSATRASADMIARLYRDTGTPIPAEIGIGRKNIFSTLNFTEYLSPGVYYLAATPDSNSSPAYELTLRLLPFEVSTPNSADAGNSATLATPIGVNGVLEIGDTFVRDIVGLTGDTADWYRLEIDQNASLNVFVTFASEHLVARLYRSTGSPIPAEIGADRTDSGGGLNFTEYLSPGIYYLAAIPDANTNPGYELTLRLLPYEVSTPNAADAGNNATLATPIGTNGVLDVGDTFVREIVGLTGDAADWYRFEVQQSSSLNVFASFASDFLVARLYRDTGSPIPAEIGIDRTDSGGGLNFTEYLSPGVYYLSAISDGDTNPGYELTLRLLPFEITTPSSADAGNTATLATPIGNNGILEIGDTFVREIVGLTRDAADWYRFEVQQNSSLNVFATFASEHTLTRLYRTTGSPIPAEIGVDRTDSGGGLNFTEYLSPGVYYLAVTPDGTTNPGYELTLRLLPYEVNTPNSADAGNTAALATLVGTNGVLEIGDTFVREIVGLTGDTVDWYRFEIKQTSTLNMLATFASEHTVARLYRDSGTPVPTEIGSDRTDGGGGLNFTMTLTPGFYYISVTPDGDTNPAYELRLRLLPA